MSASLPSIYINTTDFGRLERLAYMDGANDKVLARQLAVELERAVILHPEHLGADVVTMNATIRYAFGPDETVYERVLVFPEDYAPTGQYLSVMSPLGVALLGLRKGASMPFFDSDGMTLPVFVKDVLPPSHRQVAAKGEATVLPFVRKEPRPAFLEDEGPTPDGAA